MRLGEVVAALEPIQFDWGFFGTSKSPDWLRHAVSLWLGHDRKGMSLDWLLAIAEAGGLGIAAFFDDPGVTLYHLVRFAVASTNGYFFAIFGDWSGSVGSALARRLAHPAL